MKANPYIGNGVTSWEMGKIENRTAFLARCHLCRSDYCEQSVSGVMESRERNGWIAPNQFRCSVEIKRKSRARKAGIVLLVNDDLTTPCRDRGSDQPKCWVENTTVVS